MVDSKRAVSLVVGLFVAAIMAAFLLPVAIGAVSGPDSTTLNQTTADSPVELKNNLTVEVTNLDDATTPNEATYSVSYDGSSTTATVGEGNNQTATVGGIDVDIAPTTVTASYAVTDYEYPTTAGWGSGASSLWLIIPLFLVIPVFLYVTRMALNSQ